MADAQTHQCRPPVSPPGSHLGGFRWPGVWYFQWPAKRPPPADPPRPAPAAGPNASVAANGSPRPYRPAPRPRSEEHTSKLQSRGQLVSRLLVEIKDIFKV